MIIVIKLINCPKDKFKNNNPKCKSGSLVNSIKNLKIEYMIKKRPEITPGLFKKPKKTKFKIINSIMPSKNAS